MATQSSFITKVITAGSLVVAAALIAPASIHFNGFSTNAFAEEDGGSHEGGSKGTKGGKGGKSGSTSGKGSSTSGSGKSKSDSIYKGQGGPDETSDGKGPQRGKPTTDGAKTKPVWASEGIPEGDYGRLNIARAPQHVRDQAAAEALNTVTDWTLYQMTDLNAIVTAIKNYRLVPIVRVDSPSESIALYQSVLKTGALKDKDGNVISGSVLYQAAIFLASASDKTKPISVNTVIAMNTILGVQNPIKTPDNPATIDVNEEVRYTNEEMQAAAEAVRQAILFGHDAVIVDPTKLPAQ